MRKFEKQLGELFLVPASQLQTCGIKESKQGTGNQKLLKFFYNAKLPRLTSGCDGKRD
jgi:hypothetical protein